MKFNDVKLGMVFDLTSRKYIDFVIGVTPKYIELLSWVPGRDFDFNEVKIQIPIEDWKNRLYVWKNAIPVKRPSLARRKLIRKIFTARTI